MLQYARAFDTFHIQKVKIWVLIILLPVPLLHVAGNGKLSQQLYESYARNWNSSLKYINVMAE